MTCVGIGAMFSLAIFLQPMSAETGWTRAGISSAMTLNFLVMGAAGFGWGAVSDRFGPRIVVLTGSVLLGLALVLASRATTLPAFQLIYGILVGLAAGAFFAPMVAADNGVVRHQSRPRGLAGIGRHGRGADDDLALRRLAAHGLRLAHSDDDHRCRRLGPAHTCRPAGADAAGAAAADAAAGPQPTGDGGGFSAGKALRTPQFAILATTFFLCCAAHSGPIFHMVSYAMTCGIPAMAAVTIYSVEGLAGLGGRLLLGVLADRLGVKLVLVAGLIVQAFVIGVYLFVSQLGEFYVLAIVFGTAYGGVMPLYAVLAREYFGQRVMGTVFGAATMASSVGMALGPVTGGWIFDTVPGLRLAVHRIVRHRPRRRRHRARLPAVSVEGARRAAAGMTADGRAGYEPRYRNASTSSAKAGEDCRRLG